MTDDRIMVAEAVFNGLIGQEHLTLKEIDEFANIVAEAAMEKELDAAYERGCIVFSGWEGDPVH